jgi:3-deoxy-D-manno-octulosonic-acid transferase
LALAVCYLPLDTPNSATTFIEIIKPKYAVFTKYEYWFYFFRTLRHRHIPLYLISGIFRKKAFFKYYGGFYRQMLSFITYFFAQNEESKTLLNSLGITQVSVSGDTRFDRVAENAKTKKN